MEQELLSLPKNLSSPPGFFVEFVLAVFSFLRSVCPSIYGFWLPIWYIQTLVAQATLRCSLVDAIATKMLQSSSRSGWLLRNIHISNDNGYFPFYVDYTFPLSPTQLLTTWLYIWVQRRVSNKKQELLTLSEHLLSHPFFLVGSVLLICLAFCVVLCFV